MNNNPEITIKTGSGTDLAFAIVVMASYFSIFSTEKNFNLWEILLIITLGITYIVVGIYGYRKCSQSNITFYKIIYFFVQIFLAGIIIYLGKGAGYIFMILLPLVGHSVIMLSNKWMIIVNAIIIFSYLSALYLVKGNEIIKGLPTFLAGQVFILFFTQMAVNEEKARNEVERLVVELADANQQLRKYAIKVEELAISKERNRLAREIHDGLGHYLTTIFMQIQAARVIMKTDQNKANDALCTAQKLTQESLVDVRKSVSSLRSPLEDGLPLLERISGLISNCESIGIKCDFSTSGESRPLSPQVQLTLYRAVQEGVSNSCKHGQPTHIWISINYLEKDRIKLIVKDDGKGVEHIEEGFGLIGLRERVMLLEGQLHFASGKGEGFLLELEVMG